MSEDRGQINVGEPAGVSTHLERVLDLSGAVQLCQIDGLGDLAPDPRRARGSSLDQPALGAGPERH